MRPLRFYEHFACAYGTIWLGMMLLAIVSGSHINAGMFGAIGFPIIALIYAAIRKAGETAGTDEIREIRRELDEIRHRQNGERNS